MDRLDDLRAQMEALRAEIRTLSDTETLTEEQSTRFEAALSEHGPLNERLEAAEARAAQVAAINAAPAVTRSAGADVPGQINRRTPFDLDVRSASRSELRSGAMTVIEDRSGFLGDVQRAGLERLLARQDQDVNGGQLARRLLLTENDEYHSAFHKAVTTPSPVFTADEARALNEFRAFEARAANEGTGSAGGFGVPVLIDPTIVLTSGAADAPILGICQVDTITTDQWKGVNSAGFSWAYQAESAVVADNTPVLAQPTIPVYASRGFIPYTLEIDQDYPGFEQEMSRLLAQGYLNLVASGTMTGSGSSRPTGIFQAMINATDAPNKVQVTTVGTLGAVDVRAAWGALPERFRPRATWVMHISAENIIRAFGNNLSLSDFTVNMIADGTSVLTGRPVLLSDYAPAVTGTTGPASYAVLGDFSHFRFIQRAGMTVELVPHLFDTSTGRPTGQRGWFAFARHGYDVDTQNAFRLISNTAAGS